MDTKRRKTQDVTETSNSSAVDTGNSDVAEVKTTDSKPKPVELDAKAEKSSLIFPKSELQCSPATNPEAMEKRKRMLNSFHEQPQPQLEQRHLGPQVQIRGHHSLYEEAKKLNAKKDIVCLILSYPPVNSMNKEKHKNWLQDVLTTNHKIRRKMETFSSEQKISVSEVLSEITALLKHSFDDIEAYVPSMIIREMQRTHVPVRPIDEKLHNLAVNFATRQVLEEIENPEFQRIRIFGGDGIRVISAVEDLPQIRQRFDIVIQVNTSSCMSIIGIEENIAFQLGFSQNRGKLNEFLKTKSFLIFLDDILGWTNLYELGNRWWNPNNIQKIVCTTRGQKIYPEMTEDLLIRLHDHLLSWKLFCSIFGRVVLHSAFQHKAIDVVEKCCGHLLAVVLMARALKKVFDFSRLGSCMLSAKLAAQISEER